MEKVTKADACAKFHKRSAKSGLYAYFSAVAAAGDRALVRSVTALTELAHI